MICMDCICGSNMKFEIRSHFICIIHHYHRIWNLMRYHQRAWGQNEPLSKSRSVQASADRKPRMAYVWVYVLLNTNVGRLCVCGRGSSRPDYIGRTPVLTSSLLRVRCTVYHTPYTPHRVPPSDIFPGNYILACLWFLDGRIGYSTVGIARWYWWWERSRKGYEFIRFIRRSQHCIGKKTNFGGWQT